MILLKSLIIFHNLSHVFILLIFLLIQMILLMSIFLLKTITSKSLDSKMALFCFVPDRCRLLKETTDERTIVMRCKKFSFTSYLDSQSKKRCPHINQTLLFMHVFNGRIEHSSFEHISEYLEYASKVTRIRNMFLFMNKMTSFNVESPLVITLNRYRDLQITIANSDFKFVDSRGSPIRTCPEFNRLNSSKNYLIRMSRSKPYSTNSSPSYSLSLDFVKFGSKSLCELVLRNAQINTLFVNFLVETFFMINRPRFDLDNTTSTKSLNPFITSVQLLGHEAILDGQLLPFKV